MEICFSLPRSIPAIAEKQTRKIAGTHSCKFVFYGRCLHTWVLSQRSTLRGKISSKIVRHQKLKSSENESILKINNGYDAAASAYLVSSMISVTRWKDYFFNFWSLTTIKVGTITFKIGQNRVKFSQIINKLSKDCQTK